MPELLISGGTVYDPAHGIDGEVRDLWIDGGKMIAAPADASVKADRTLNASGYVVMPGGIDIHSHIAGPKVNMARKMRPEGSRQAEPVRRTMSAHSGTMGSVPSTFATGYKYAGMGYTTAFDAAVSPLFARHAHEELENTPCIDKGFYVLVGNNHYVMQALRNNDSTRVKSFLAWLLSATKGYAAKIVNPGGVEEWKLRASGNVHSLDEKVHSFDVSPRQIIQALAGAVDELGMPHAVHIHCNNLGLPGNWTTTLETMQTLEGRRGHLAHIQFHSYAGGDVDEETFGSQVSSLAEFVNNNANITVDVGQVLFGETTSMTADGPIGYYLHNIYKTKWFSADIESESGCGIAPIAYKNKSLVHAFQWAIGLEWFLLVNDPWQVAMSTDHPNGSSFLAYPQIIRLLMDRAFRDDVLKTVHPHVRQRSVLADLKREYSLYEICIITRAGPARMLGLANKGHLGPGADADITIYLPDDDKQKMFELPRYVIKAGRVIVDNGEIKADCYGKTLHISPAYDTSIEGDISNWFDRHYSIRFRNYPVGEESRDGSQVIPCRND
ncbi:MAG: formylmethanofuran dehydrogenase subunit A [Pirellulales bacterium]|nr:formylmethanofuran dehydrogenase subunit A [Pirellulales bacterium]